MVNAERLDRLEIPGRVTFLEGNGDLPKIEVTAERGRAEIYLHGAHVTDFQSAGQAPLLFTSQFSRFAPDNAIRGGIPIVFPWFGPRDGMAMHGVARVAEWKLHEATSLPEGGASLRFSLPETEANYMCPPFTAYYVVTVTDKLALELIVTNCSRDQQFAFENCLHSYFCVSDVAQVSITGLAGASFLDKVDGYRQKTEGPEPITISSEVDRVYLDTTNTVEIVDRSLSRKIIVEKSGSKSTVLWNPWIAKAQQMPDFGNEEYRQMVCVESGNVGANKVVLPPGHSSVLRVVLSSVPL